MSVYESTVSWLRQTVACSNSRSSWFERGILALFVVLAAAIGTITAIAAWWISAGLWVLYLVAMVVCTRQGWLQLFGPVLFYDMIRTARQNRYFFMRMFYSALLLLVLWVFFTTATVNRPDNDRDAALLAESFFTIFMNVQLGMVVLLTPAYVAGAIAEEKDRKTLEFMLATDLSNHEIVLSKLCSRLANITLFLMTGLPILSILQFVGGVDTDLMLSGFAGTGLTMLGIASMCILFSTLLQRPRDAIGLSYLTVVTYGALGTLGKAMVEDNMFLMREPIWYSDWAPTYGEVSQFLNAGNPIAALVDVAKAIDRATLAADLPAILLKYTLFHGILTIVCVVWSIVRLRAVALKQTVGGRKAKLEWWQADRPVVGDLPMVWKELNIEGRLKLNWLGWAIVVVLVMLTLGSGILVICYNSWDELFQVRMNGHTLTEEVNFWFRIAGTGVSSLMLIMIGVRASTSIAAERERDTFDALLTTPLSPESILGAKLLGVLTSMRMAWLWFGTMLAMALVTGGLHLFAVPILIGAWFVYACFFAMLGLWFSMVCRTSMRATVFTVLTSLFVGGGHWILMGLCCYIPSFTLMRGGNQDDFLAYVAKFETGMTPPAVIAVFSYSWENLATDFSPGSDAVQWYYFCLIGVFLWAIACVFLWYGMLLPKFREITRREELIYQ